MSCFYCKGQTIEQMTKFIVDLGRCVVIVKNVPGQVCQQCGETSYSDEVAQQLDLGGEDRGGCEAEHYVRGRNHRLFTSCMKEGPGE